jgi:hypothetical protein
MAAGKGTSERVLTALGERVMLAAEEAGFTQTSLERAARFSGGYMTRLLTRPQDRIDMSKLERLSDLLGVRMHWLATGREPMREGGQRTAVEEGMVIARQYGVTEDVFWYVRARDMQTSERENWSPTEWWHAFLAENKRRLADAAYAKAAKRVAMSEERRAVRQPATESTAR